MKRVRYEIRTYEVELVCSCSGLMRPTGMALGRPPIYPHECKECGHVSNQSMMYPIIEYERIES